MKIKSDLPKPAFCRGRCDECGRVITYTQYRIDNVHEYEHPYLSLEGTYNPGYGQAHKDCSKAIHKRSNSNETSP